MTDEDIYLLDGFNELIDKRAVDMIHPDLDSAGGIIETKRIGDYAMQNGIAMMLHYAGAPFGFMASVYAAAATENFVAPEHRSVDNPTGMTSSKRIRAPFSKTATHTFLKNRIEEEAPEPAMKPAT